MLSPCRAAVLILACLASTACTEGPFVSTKIENIIPKPTATGRVRSGFDICFADGTTEEQIWQLARQTCADYRLTAELQRVLKWQCRLTAPHLARFSCIAPDQPADPTGLPTLPPR